MNGIKLFIYFQQNLKPKYRLFYRFVSKIVKIFKEKNDNRITELIFLLQNNWTIFFFMSIINVCTIILKNNVCKCLVFKKNFNKNDYNITNNLTTNMLVIP